MKATSDYLNLPVREESDVRELARAKIRAQLAWDTFCKQNRNGLSEDEQINRTIESHRLCKALNDAEYALHCAVSS